MGVIAVSNLRDAMIQETVMTLDGRVARLVLYCPLVQDEADYECEPADIFTLTEVQRLAKDLWFRRATASVAEPCSGSLGDTG
jgi:hypothetical protein